MVSEWKCNYGRCGKTIRWGCLLLNVYVSVLWKFQPSNRKLKTKITNVKHFLQVARFYFFNNCKTSISKKNWHATFWANMLQTVLILSIPSWNCTYTTLWHSESYFSSLQQYNDVRNVKATAEEVTKARSQIHFLRRQEALHCCPPWSSVQFHHGQKAWHQCQLSST